MLLHVEAEGVQSVAVSVVGNREPTQLRRASAVASNRSRAITTYGSPGVPLVQAGAGADRPSSLHGAGLVMVNAAFVIAWLAVSLRGHWDVTPEERSAHAKRAAGAPGRRQLGES